IQLQRQEDGNWKEVAPSGGNNFHREILPRFQLVDQCENLPQAGSHLFPVSIFLTLQLNDTTLGQMIGKFDGLGALVAQSHTNGIAYVVRGRVYTQLDGMR